MSHSQFHSTKLFILGHAWLNLWDKHMTTGRINQVTTFLWPPIGGEEFILWFKYVNPSLRDWSCSTTNRHSTLSPGLTSFRHTASCLWTRIMVLQENYPSISFITGLWWILKCTSCNKLGYQQTVHIPSLFASTEYVCSDSISTTEKLGSKSPIPNQPILLTYRNALLIRHRTSQPTPFQRKAKGILYH